MATSDGVSVLLASNRGPASFSRGATGELECHSAASGGLAAALGTLPPDSNALWISAARSDPDRAAARAAPRGHVRKLGHDTGTVPVRLLDIDQATYTDAYDGIANSVLWFMHHMLFDSAAEPVFDTEFRRQWAAYVSYNTAFADALAEEATSRTRVLIQDYHLGLTPKLLRQRRPELLIAHFSHTPWAPFEYFRMLPDDVAVALLEGMLAADHLGFLTERWAAAFGSCCEELLGASVDRGLITYADRETTIGVHPLGIDAARLRSRADNDDVRVRMSELRDLVQDRKLIVRVDRVELSKNIVRGLAAYRDLLRRYPQWRGQVVHVALAYPSRHSLPEYRDYARRVQTIGQEIVEEFSTADWNPLVLSVDDDYARSLAAYRLADVALVNPVRDGMNLVAKEIPTVSDRGCALVLSREAGAAAELAPDSFLINPYDIEATADALHAALSMSDTERLARSQRLAWAAAEHPPSRWLADQLAALTRAGSATQQRNA